MIYSVKVDFTMQNYSLIYKHVLPLRVIYSDDVFPLVPSSCQAGLISRLYSLDTVLSVNIYTTVNLPGRMTVV